MTKIILYKYLAYQVERGNARLDQSERLTLASAIRVRVRIRVGVRIRGRFGVRRLG